MSRTLPSWSLASPWSEVRKTVCVSMLATIAVRMRYTGKVVGGLIGMFLGPLGAVAGVLLGHQVDEHLDRQDAPLPGPEELAAIGERFFRATFRVMGYVAKADGPISAGPAPAGPIWCASSSRSRCAPRSAATISTARCGRC